MSELRPGDKLGDYEILGELAIGGMGRVYRARDARLDRTVAIKIVSTPRASDEQFRRRFRREALHVAAVDHPNVIPIYGVGETAEGEPYLAMRFVAGTDLAEEVARGGPLEPGLAISIIEQTGRALDAAHERGLVHRDVKPANVLLSGSGSETHVYLTDFGLTKELSGGSELTLSGQWFGTAAFAAPEQIEGGDVGPAADIYALGCVLYFCLVGRQPFTGEPAQVMWSHVNDALPALPRSIRNAAALDAVIARATAKVPNDRWRRGAELARAAAQVLEGQELITQPLAGPAEERPTARTIAPTAAPPSAATTVIRRRRRWPFVAAAAAAIAVTGFAVAAALGVFNGSDEGTDSASPDSASSATPADDAPASKASPSAQAAAFVRTLLDPQSGATARLPRGKRSLEDFGGLRQRTRVDTPSGAVLVVDYTPQDAPNPGAAFSTTGRFITNPNLGLRAAEYVATACEEGQVCVDYPLDLGGYGFGVLGAASTRTEARQLARKAARTLKAPASALQEPDVVEDCVSAYGPNVADLSVRNIACSDADDLTAAVIRELQPGVFESAGFSCQILGDYGPRDGGPILGASDIRCTQGNQSFRFSWGD